MNIKVKPIINKSNGQINVSLKKGDLPKRLLKDIDTISKIEFKINRWF